MVIFTWDIPFSDRVSLKAVCISAGMFYIHRLTFEAELYLSVGFWNAYIVCNHGFDSQKGSFGPSPL